MKNILIVLLLLCGQYSIAQIKGFVGMKGGGTLSTAYIEHTIFNTFMNTGYVPGYNAGMMLKVFSRKPKISGMNGGIQSGLYLERKGWKQTFETTEPSYHVNMTYLVLPFEAIGYIGKGNTKLFLTAGIFFEQLVDVKKDPDPDLDNIGRGIEFYTYDQDRDNDFGYGGRASLGVQHSLPFGTFHVDGYFSYSANSFIKSTDLSSRLPDITNHYLVGFSVAYLIPFGKLDF